jgi:hypothetical protein
MVSILSDGELVSESPKLVELVWDILALIALEVYE